MQKMNRKEKRLARKKLKEFKKFGLPYNMIREMVKSFLKFIGYIGDVCDKDVHAIITIYPQIKFIPEDIAMLIVVLKSVKTDNQEILLTEQGEVITCEVFKGLLVDAQSSQIRKDSLLAKLVTHEQYNKNKQYIDVLISYMLIKGGVIDE